MLVFYAIAVAIMISAGQAFWKVSSSAAEGVSTFEKLLKTGLEPTFWAGALLYAVATLAYIYLLGKYSYHQVQLTIIGTTLVSSIIIASVVFNEVISPTAYLGAVLIIIGVMLVVS